MIDARSGLTAIVNLVLENSGAFEWSLQGFGMLRAYAPGGWRINIWTKEFRVPNVSMIHTHPWHFKSYVERGHVRNTRFTHGDGAPTHSSAIIKPGIGGGVLNQALDVQLIPSPVEVYPAGQSYGQTADEIHLSDPDDWTITLNKRERVAGDVARVYWPVGESWVDAMPRLATISEVRHITSIARENGGAQ